MDSGGWDLDTGLFTIPRSGLYHVVAYVHRGSSSDDSEVSFSFNGDSGINTIGSAYSRARNIAGLRSPQPLVLMTLRHFDEGDTVALYSRYGAIDDGGELGRAYLGGHLLTGHRVYFRASYSCAAGEAGDKNGDLAFSALEVGYPSSAIFSTADGRFTAPYDGYYHFFVHVFGKGNDSELCLEIDDECNFVAPGSAISRGMVNGNSDAFQPLVVKSIIKLTKGQTVHVGKVFGLLHINCKGVAYFGGFMLDATKPMVRVSYTTFGVVESPATVVFNRVEIDNFGGYSSSTGLYTAPYSGYYHFFGQTYSGWDSADSAITFIIRGSAEQDQVGQAISQSQMEGGRYRTLNLMTHIYLEKGDTIGLYVSVGKVHYNQAVTASFSGFML